jgi:hemerythrin-like domain-containing protein
MEKMKTATKNLEDDHVHILRLIDVMEQITHSADPDVTHLQEIVRIIKNFADGLHHAKEETIFFPYLAERGFSLNQGPVAVMLQEHVQGRNFVRGIEESINAYIKGDKNSIGEIYMYMNLYAELLRNHISKENNILFRMADNALTETDQTNLLEKFAEAETRFVSGSASAEYHDRINDLVSFYKVYP